MNVDKLWRNVDKVLFDESLSMKEFATRAGINYDTLRSWRTRGLPPKLEEAKLMADSLGMTIDSLFFGNTKKEKDEEETRLAEAIKKADSITKEMIYRILNISYEKNVQEEATSLIS